MPGCFTGISINSPIFSLILGVPAITMSRLFRNSTHFIDSTGLTYTNFLRNPGPHPSSILDLQPDPQTLVLAFFLLGLTTTNWGGCFFNFGHRTVPGFFGSCETKTPKAKALKESPKSNTDKWAPETSYGFRRGTCPKEWFLAAVTMEEHFFGKNGKQHFEEDQVMVLMLPCSLIDRLWTLQHGILASSGRQWVCHAIIRPILLGCIKSTSLHRCFMYISCCWNEAWLSINQEFHNIHWCGWLVVSQSDRNRCCQHRHRLSCLRMLSIVVFFHQARFHLADASPSNLFISAQWPASCMGWIFKMKVYLKSAKFIYTLQLHLRHLRHLERKKNVYTLENWRL